MTLDPAYTAINLGVMPAWALLAFAPRAKVTQRLVHSFAYPVIYGALYSAFLIAAIFFGQSSPDAGMASIGGVSALFSHPVGVMTGWTHYLVFDLFVGAWISRDALSRAIPYWRVLPALFFTLMFGPVGLLIYFVIRLVSGRGGFSIENSQRDDAE